MLLSRRQFCAVAGGALGAFSIPAPGFSSAPLVDAAAIDRKRILRAAADYLQQKPVTITSFVAMRSAGDSHDYFSEGDYWWPNPKDPDGPYIRRDGLSNPNNFVAHREALIGFSVQMPTLAAAWLVTHDKTYAEHSAAHLRAWFVDPHTRMKPGLEYAQAIHGVTPGRGTGIIDTIHLVEVARAATVLAQGGVIDQGTLNAVRLWFAEYLQWMTTSKNGIEERDAKNNHGTCWVLQVAEFARFTADEALLQYAADRYKKILLPTQMKTDGSFPLELARTKPYSYSLFNLDVMATLCQILNLLDYELPDGRGIRRALAFMYPYIKTKASWPFPHDVEYFDDFPVRQPSLLFGGLAFSRPDYLALWERLNPDPAVPEIVRNFPIRQPVLWIG
jgi:hypothetical protein